MIYTSGTSGRPKGVKRRRPGSVAATLAAARAYGRRVALDGSGPHLVTGPTYHAAPPMFAVYDQLNGAPILVMPRFDAGETLKLLAGREVHHTHLVPTQFVRLLRLPAEQRESFAAPALHLVLHGAAPVSPAVKRRWRVSPDVPAGPAADTQPCSSARVRSRTSGRTSLIGVPPHRTLRPAGGISGDPRGTVWGPTNLWACSAPKHNANTGRPAAPVRAAFSRSALAMQSTPTQQSSTRPWGTINGDAWCPR